MTEQKQLLKQLIQERRPNLSNSSLTTYSSILRNLHKKVFGDEELFNLDNFENTTKVLNYLKETPPNKRKTILSALVIITLGRTADEYRTKMNEDVAIYNEEIEQQLKTDAQRDGWVETNEIDCIFNSLKNEAKILYKKQNSNASVVGKTLSTGELQKIQNYIIMALLSGKFIPPRRSLDYTEFKIKNIDKEKDNYLDKNKLVFNTYKTATTYGRQEVEIPKELKSILTKWIKINPTEYLLFDKNMNKLTAVKLNQRMNKIFSCNNGCSVNAMRHTFLTDKYKDTSKGMNNLATDMTNMGSSINVVKNYVKID